MTETSIQVNPLEISNSGKPLATIVPCGKNQVTPVLPVCDRHYALSRFAYWHVQNGQMILESPLAHTQVILHDWWATSLLHYLAHPRTLAQLYIEFSNIGKDTITTFLSWLLGGKFLTVTDEDGIIEEEPSLALWEFHDLLFHTRSRLGRHNYPYGKSAFHPSNIKPIPAVKSLMSSQVIPLYQPDIEGLIKHDIPFTRVMEERRSLRLQGTQPITTEQLGEFLYRTARIKGLTTSELGAYEFSDRPYPSGGACYELELYVVIAACEGLMPGLYHYCPNEHVFCQLKGYTSDIMELLYKAATQPSLPQVLIILAARFPRVTWKYRSLSYSLILKHVGVLYQSMYLVATAMGLASCAIGGGDSDLFARSTGIDYYAETSVGEFILGSRANS